MLDLKQIDNSWTLFLDRDGVINKDKNGSYIFNKEEFIFLDGVVEAISKMADLFHTIVVVTNQKGVGKGLMSLDDLHCIHHFMLDKIGSAGGKIHKIYYCSDLEDASPNRKPNPGMAFQAKQDFPSINFSKSIIVGNKLSDMKFGRNAGMFTVVLATTNPETVFPNEFTDLRFNTLAEFADALTKS